MLPGSCCSPTTPTNVPARTLPYPSFSLLEHSSPHLTNEVYTNVDPALRQAVDILPVTDWL
jgi:hypothetical protein